MSTDLWRLNKLILRVISDKTKTPGLSEIKAHPLPFKITDIQITHIHFQNI